MPNKPANIELKPQLFIHDCSTGEEGTSATMFVSARFFNKMLLTLLRLTMPHSSMAKPACDKPHDHMTSVYGPILARRFSLHQDDIARGEQHVREVICRHAAGGGHCDKELFLLHEHNQHDSRHHVVVACQNFTSRSLQNDPGWKLLIGNENHHVPSFDSSAIVSAAPIYACLQSGQPWPYTRCRPPAQHT